MIISQNIDANLHVVNISTSFDIMKDNFKIVRIIIEDLLGLCAYIHDFLRQVRGKIRVWLDESSNLRNFTIPQAK